MAKQIEPTKQVTGRTRYPWNQWADGQWWLLERGKDYTCDDHSMRRAAYARGKKVGQRVETQAHADGIHVRFVPPVKLVKVEAKPKKKLKRGVRKTPQMVARLWMIRNGDQIIWTQKSGWKKTLAELCEMKTMDLHKMNRNGEFLDGDYKLIEEFRRQKRIARSK